MNHARPRLLHLGVDATAPVEPSRGGTRDNPTRRPRAGGPDRWVANPSTAPLGGGWVA